MINSFQKFLSEMGHKLDGHELFLSNFLKDKNVADSAKFLNSFKHNLCQRSLSDETLASAFNDCIVHPLYPGSFP